MAILTTLNFILICVMWATSYISRSSRPLRSFLPWPPRSSPPTWLRKASRCPFGYRKSTFDAWKWPEMASLEPKERHFEPSLGPGPAPGFAASLQSCLKSP